MKSFKNTLFLLPLLTIFLFTTGSSAQTNGLDDNFIPLVTVTSGVGTSAESVQPDGKVIVAGNFTIVNGVIRPNVVRLNTDGSVDPSFNCAACTFSAASTLIQPDGKILLAGSDISPFGSVRPQFIRLNSDGSQDLTFAFPFTGVGIGDRYAAVRAIQADGKIYATLFSNAPQFTNTTLYRVNPNGTLDSGYTTLSINERPSSGQRLSGVTVMPDGRVFVYGYTPYGYLNRLNADGTEDTSFEEPTLTYPPGNAPGQPVRPYVVSFGEQSDGKIVITGQFDSVNAVEKNHAARLNTNGSVDAAYTPQPAFLSSGNAIIKMLPGDKALMVRYDTPKRIVLHNPDGSVDNSYSAPDALTSVGRWEILSNDQLLVWGTYNGTDRYVRLNGDGSVDNSFTSPTFEREGTVRKVLSLAGNKSMIYGVFDRVNGVARAGLARLNADGTLDTAFDPGTGFDSGTVYGLAAQSDGKIIAGGVFNGYNGFPQPQIVRINTDGSADTGFVVGPSAAVRTVAVRPDGKILIGGEFVTIGVVVKPRLAQLNSNGTIDDSFNAVIGSNSTHQVRSVFIQADGKLMAGGSFTGAGGFNRNDLVRLNSDGSVDGTFNAGSIGFVDEVIQLPDGRYLTHGNGLRRLVSTGAADGTFTSPTVSGINSFVPGPGGTIIIGGSFTTVNGTAKNYIARILSDGSLDILFNPNGANKIVWSFSPQADGKILVGGEFTLLGGAGRINVARLITSAVANVTPFDFDGDGRADISVTRPADFNWYQLTGINYNFRAIQFGQPGDKVTPADFDGDGKTDIGVFHPATGNWSYLSSLDGLGHTVHWGQNGDIPFAADYTGDGKAELIAIRNFGWWMANTNGQIISYTGFGQTGDKPLIGDFDGDGKTDFAVYRPSEGNWYYAASGSGGATVGFHWGISEDIPVPADYDGDGKTDAAVFRPSEGNWYVLSSIDGTWIGLHFGLTGDKPIAADYDGDGKADIAVYRPSDHYWYVLGTTAGFYGFPFGLTDDIPSPNAYIQP